MCKLFNISIRLPPCTVLIYLQLMQSGLVRVRVQHHGGTTGRGAQLATPLIDGAVVSRRSLGPLVRQTAINVSRRRRLDSDSYQPPHVRRRLKLQDILHKYKRDLTIPELLTYLFTTPWTINAQYLRWWYRRKSSLESSKLICDETKNVH